MGRRRIRPKWLRLTEETNAFDYLRQAYNFIVASERDPMAWKWVIIALHGALAVAACRGTNPDNVTLVTKKDKRKLIGFWEALRRSQDPQWMHMTIRSKPLVLSAKQGESIRKLKQIFRNEFEHYIPKDWSIEIHGMPQIAIDVLDVIRFLAIETGNYVNLTVSQQRKLRSLVFQSKRTLRRSALFQEGRSIG